MIARVRTELALEKEFDYWVPPELAAQVEPGSRVKVPFGPRQVLATVVAVADSSPQPNLRPITKVLGGQSLVTPQVMQLARWMAGYYCCPLELALKSVVPVAVRQEEAGWKKQLFVRLLPAPASPPELTPRQAEVLRVLEEWWELPLQAFLKAADTTAPTVRKLEDLGLVAIQRDITERDPYASEHILPTQPLVLNPEQAAALDRIKAALQPLIQSRGGAAPGPAAAAPGRPAAIGEPGTFLLHGVTGSGKTEVYLQAIAHALEHGLGAIVLVPEISLTPQTVERFKARFCAGPLQTVVAVLHSHLSGGERHDEWHKIRDGRARIVIGARSAIFAPMDPLGLIIVDEEHEHSYKQEETPRYHARDVAVMRGQLARAVVVLGSATPCLESYYNARQGKYALLELPTRVDDQKMPLIRIVDLRDEMHKQHGPPIFSLKLKEAITQRLERGEQTMLFLNRRGYATSLQCPKCGYVAGCPNCSITLTYHRQAQKLCCHLCGHEVPAPTVCPEAHCRNPGIRYAGLGTEKVEATLAKLFPQARVKRMDSDTLKRKEDYRRVLSDFRVGKIDILVGTQMIAKGLHFPNVTLVGIIYADLSLHVPDFRAGERTFQLLTQVAGRAGRGDVEGEVFVQSFTPFHPAIQYARRHDYQGFYEQELETREQLRYPPVSRVALLTLRGRNEDKVRFAADHLKHLLEPVMATLADPVLLGPAPAPLVRAESYYRYQIMLRCRQMTRLSRELSALAGRLSLPDDVSLQVDIDPVNLM
jgi:primosomal protein N' (replication factor Y)